MPRLLPGLAQATPNSTSTLWRRDHANLSSENKLRPSPSVTSTKPSSTTGCEGCSPRSRSHNSLRTCRFCSSSEGAARPNPPGSFGRRRRAADGEEAATSPFTPTCSCAGSGTRGATDGCLPAGKPPRLLPCAPQPQHWPVHCPRPRGALGLLNTPSPFPGQGEQELGRVSSPPHLGREVDQLWERQLVPLITLQEIQQTPCRAGRAQGEWLSRSLCQPSG